MDSKCDTFGFFWVFFNLQNCLVASYGKVHFDINRTQNRTGGRSFHRELIVQLRVLCLFAMKLLSCGKYRFPS